METFAPKTPMYPLFLSLSGLDCLLLDQLALADGLLASAEGLPAVPSTHHAPVGLVQHGWVLHRALFQARAPPAALRA